MEAVKDGVRQPDARSLGDAHGAVLRLWQLVQDLKTLSVTREGQFVTPLALHDLAQIAQDATDSIGPRAAHAILRLACPIDGGLIAQCDADRIRQVIDNLIENALRYKAPAPPATPCHVCLSGSAGANNRARCDGGSGLGLPNCDATVKAHGGTIAARMLDLALPDDSADIDRIVDSDIKNAGVQPIASVWDPVRAIYGVGYACDA